MNSSRVTFSKEDFWSDENTKSSSLLDYKHEGTQYRKYKDQATSLTQVFSILVNVNFKAKKLMVNKKLTLHKIIK